MTWHSNSVLANGNEPITTNPLPYFIRMTSVRNPHTAARFWARQIFQ